MLFHIFVQLFLTMNKYLKKLFLKEVYTVLMKQDHIYVLDTINECGKHEPHVNLHTQQLTKRF